MPKLKLILIIAQSELVNLSTERTMTAATMFTTCVWWKYHPCRVTLGLNRFSALVDLTLHLGKPKCGNIVDLTLTVKHQQSDPPRWPFCLPLLPPPPRGDSTLPTPPLVPPPHPPRLPRLLTESPCVDIKGRNSREQTAGADPCSDK